MTKTRTTGALLAAAALTPAAITAPAFAHDGTGDQTPAHQDNGRHCGWTAGRAHNKHQSARKASPRSGQGCPMPQRKRTQTPSQQQPQTTSQQTAQASQASQASHASHAGCTG